ncbi:MAG TPA: TetR/AcrR family transcriptional regulator [Thermomonospora sp.]|nr:TetR/AcrR family transcriptional regulator [Thermomonospora sp.]
MSDDDAVRAVAARLFAELGYDAVSLEMIADATGLDVDTVTARHGAKRDLYFEIIKRRTQQRREYLRPVVEAFTPDAEGMIRLYDRYLDYCLEHPELPSLWMHRAMSDAGDLVDVDRFSGAWLTEMHRLTRPAFPDDVDSEMIRWTVIWSIHGFVQGGLLGTDGRRHHATDPRTVRRFREHMHHLFRVTARPAPSPGRPGRG